MNIFFPYEKIREFQSDFISDISEMVNNKKSLIAHAPTGLGKTAATISVLLKISLEKNLTIFFITPRHTQHKIVVDTLNETKKKFNLDFEFVDIIGKKSMCGLANIESLTSSEFAEYCRHVVDKKECNFFNNIYNKKEVSTKAIMLLNELKNKGLHAEQLKAISSSNSLCPYEISCLLARDARVIIGDYHHMLNPYIRDILLKRIGKSSSEIILVIDEAHNVIERSRELLSSRISNLTIERARKEAIIFGNTELAESISFLDRILNDLALSEPKADEMLVPKDEFISFVQHKTDYYTLINELEKLSKIVYETKRRSYSASLAKFLNNWLGPDQAFVRILSKIKNPNGSFFITLSYNCLDPSLITKPLSESLYSIILMSGTLTPPEVYKEILSIEAECKSYQSPFPRENKLALIVPETTTQFKSRTDDMYKHIAKKSVDITEAVPGNSFLFFPSYELRNSVYKHFHNSSKTIFLEEKNMTKSDRSELLKRFSSYKDTGAVLFAVTGGSFGEGIDMPGDLLKAVIIVGLPFSRPDLETKKLIEYYDKKYKNGMHYGYVLPAFVKCFQNAGRCIRSENDRGIIVYLDERYSWDSYFKYFPQTEYIKITKEPIEIIKEFFKIKK